MDLEIGSRVVLNKSSISASLINADPENVDLITRGLSRLARLAATHFHLNAKDETSLTDAMRNVLDDIERTLGPKGD